MVHVAGRWTVLVAHAHLQSFPPVQELPQGYFQRCKGELLKQERHTTILLVSQLPGAKCSLPQNMALKTYQYRSFSKIRTFPAISKPEREYLALAQCAALGVPALEPVACATLRDGLGMVESCFLMTQFEKGRITMRDWFKKGEHETPEGESFLRETLAELGEKMRVLHENHFFFLGCSAKNVLLNTTDAVSDKWLLLDMPYARFLHYGLLARQGQQWDLGSLYGTVTKYAGEDAFESFFGAYLPDPLGGGEAALRRRVKSYGGIHNKEDVLSKIKRQVYPVIMPWKTKQ